MNRSTTAVADAYVDVLIFVIFTELAETLEVSYDDEIYVLAHLNTRNRGVVEFSGLAVTLPNAALN